MVFSFQVSYSHAIHASGFFIAFFVSLVLTCAVFFILYRTQLLRWSFYSENQVSHIFLNSVLFNFVIDRIL